MRRALILLPLAVLSTSLSAEPSSVGCRMLADGKSSPEEIDRFYGTRAVEIIERGLAGDEASLGGLVAPNFSYTIQDADSFFGPRNEEGVSAAIKFAKYLAAKRYRISSPITFVLLRKDQCEWKVTVVFDRALNSEAITADFTFSDDKLIRVDGRTLVEFRGDLP